MSRSELEIHHQLVQDLQFNSSKIRIENSLVGISRKLSSNKNEFIHSNEIKPNSSWDLKSPTGTRTHSTCGPALSYWNRPTNSFHQMTATGLYSRPNPTPAGVSEIQQVCTHSTCGPALSYWNFPTNSFPQTATALYTTNNNSYQFRTTKRVS